MEEHEDIGYFRLIRTMRHIEPYVPEYILTICSIWAAFVLMQPPPNFITCSLSFHVARELAGEGAWAEFAIVSAGLKMVGLLLYLTVKRNPFLMGLSYGLRIMGLSCSGMFWTLLAISTLIGNPDSLYSCLGLAAGLSAWWILLRGPTVYEERA